MADYSTTVTMPYRAAGVVLPPAARPQTIVTLLYLGGGWGGGAVASVFTRTGAVTAQTGDYTKAQVGLGNVDNTSDVNKPVSTAQAAADAAVASAAATDATSKANAAQTAATAAADTYTDGKITAEVARANAAYDALGAAAAAQAAAIAASQPLDSDLTAIASLATTTYGRAFLALADAAAARTALALGTAATQASTAFDAAGAAAAAQAASQPLDSDLTAIAALTTTTYGRAFLALADAAAGRTALGLGTLATQSGTFSGTSSGTNTGDQDLSSYATTAALDGRYWPPAQAIAGMDVHYDGHSYVAGSTGTFNTYGWAKRITAAQMLNSGNVNGVSGNWMVDAAMRLKTATGAGSKGRCYILDCVINDVQAPASKSSAKGLAGFQNSLAYWLHINRASSRVEANAGAFAYTGTWATDTTTTSGQYPANNKYTTTQNDFVDITVTVPTGATYAVLMLYGLDDASSGITGAAFTVKEGVTTLVTGTTSNQYLKGGNGAGGSSWAACPMPVVVALAAGAHTLRLTKTDATGSRLWIQAAILPPSSTSPIWQEVVVKALTGITFNSTTPTDITNYNNAVDTVVNSFAVSDSSIIVVDPTTGPDGWDTATMLLSTDGLHPNQKGYAAMGRAINAALNTLGYRSQINVL